jgi:hypothetical protein
MLRLNSAALAATFAMATRLGYGTDIFRECPLEKMVIAEIISNSSHQHSSNPTGKPRLLIRTAIPFYAGVS